MQSVLRAARSLRATRRVRRVVRVRWIVGSLAAVLLIGGCGSSGPDLVGSAAIVNGAAIPVKQVQGQSDELLDQEDAQFRAQLVADRKLDEVSRFVLTQLVTHELVSVAAQRDGLSVEPTEVSALLYELGGPEIAPRAEEFRQQAEDRLLRVQIGRRTLGTAVTFDYTTATTRDDAIRRAQELAAAGPRGARDLISADMDAGTQAGVGKRVVAGDDPIFASSPVFGVAKDSVVAFQLADSNSWLIAAVRNRVEGAEPSDAAPDPAQIDPDVLDAIGLRQLAPLSDDVGVRLSPRYGVWDTVTMQAVRNETETGGIVLPLAGTPRA